MIKALSTYLEENEAKISKETINTYKSEIPTAPSIYKASALSKALNFSLDELRDSYFKFGELKENVDGKLLEYHQLYCTAI